MRQHDQWLVERDVAVCVVTFDADFMARAYIQETGLEWPLLVDAERSLYRGYGMERGSVWDIYGPSAIGVYLKLMLRGRSLRSPGRDVHQLGGDVLIDPEGLVRLHHVGAGPADRPEAGEILDLIEAPLSSRPE